MIKVFRPLLMSAVVSVLVIGCGQNQRPARQEATTAENFGVRSVDPWADDNEEQSEPPQGRRVYVPEPEQEAENEQTSDEQGNTPGQTPTPESGNPADDEPGDGSGDDANDPPNTEDNTPPEEQTPPPAPPSGIQGPFAFNDAASLLYVQVFKDENTLGARFAHNHAIRATGWQGSLERNGDGTDCIVSLELPVDGLVPDEAAMRRRVGYNDEISANQRQEIRGHMLAENQLNIDTYPTMSFRGTRCTGADADRGRLSVEGQLTIRGVAKSVRMNLEYRLLDGSLYLRGELEITHRDFGFTPYSAFGGSVRNQERMILGFDFQSTANN